MSDEGFDDQQDSPNWRRELEEKARRADDLEAQLAEVKRQQAFNEAGITSANPAYKYFTKGYDGEMTVDAIKVAATEAGVLQTNQQASAQQDSPMLSQYDRIANASEGATPAPTTDLVEGINQAQTVEEVMALMSSHNDPRTGQAFRTTWNQQ